MRLWSIHPMYLDSTGLTACWREALLARKVLCGATKGYTRHPQLLRFRELETPELAIEAYLCTIYQEALSRGYRYDGTKINLTEILPVIGVTHGQLAYEMEHLRRKLSVRNIPASEKISRIETILPNPVFIPRQGPVEAWESIR